MDKVTGWVMDMREKLDELKKYIYKELNIDGIDTYLICPEHFSTVAKLLNLHSSSLSLLEIANKVKSVVLYPAVVYIPRFAEKYRWMPVLCYANGQDFFHISYHSGWICRECGANNGSVIMPLSEADTIYYEFPLPEIPKIFHKINCKKCGKELQNHLILLNEIEFS